MSKYEEHGQNSDATDDETYFNNSDYSLGEDDDLIFEQNVTSKIELDAKKESIVGPEGVEPVFSNGTISTSQASIAEVVNQVSSKIGEPSSVEIGRPCGAPLLYSQLIAASGVLNVKEPEFYSQHGSSTTPNLPRSKAKPMRKAFTPQRRFIVRNNSISTTARHSTWTNLMNSRPR
ncbi:Uncharacterized protein Fot_30466 [Forsythia ovata]|uniref:Uncharacterized protein n=1 Tax=Forsythia ovata TaxID=205694 RepID=A0ABD1TUT9_9LAMI